MAARDSKSNSEKRLPGKVATQVCESASTLIRYRPLGDTAVWLRHFVSNDRGKSAAFGCVGTLFGLPALTGVLFVSGLTMNGKFDGFSSLNLLLFVLLLPLIFFGYRGARIMLQPTHVELGSQGFRVLYVQLGRKTDWIPWSSVASISMERKDDSTMDEQELKFHTTNGPIVITLSGLVDIHGPEQLLTALQRWGKNIPKDHLVLSSLESQQQNTFTELWLQSLSEPPQRERLTPLSGGAQLKESTYAILDIIGGGGQGTAYTAKVLKEGPSRSVGDIVVLKEYVLPLHVTLDARKSSIERLQNEAKVLRAIDHPLIVKLIDFFIEDHRGYLVMERISGTNLRKRVLQSGRLSTAEVLALGVQMCDVLYYLHSLSPPVVHRDFTPDNIILDDQGRPHLIDFNVAMQSSGTTTATVVGKHAYVPPEQFRGKPCPQSDIYAMGATLYFLLCGHDPEPLEPAHPEKENSTVPPALDELIARCTNIDPDLRFGDADEVKNTLISIQ